MFYNCSSRQRIYQLAVRKPCIVLRCALHQLLQVNLIARNLLDCLPTNLPLHVFYRMRNGVIGVAWVGSSLARIEAREPKATDNVLQHLLLLLLEFF